MDSLVTIFIAVIATLTFGVGLLALIRNPRARVNQALFALSVSIALWMLANFYSNQLSFSYDRLLLMNKLTFLFGTGTIGFLPVFLGRFVGSNLAKKVDTPITISIFLIGILSLTSLFVGDIVPKEPVTEIVFGSASWLYFTALLSYIVFAAIFFWQGRRSLTGLKRARFQVIGWSTIGALTLVILTNLLLPFLFDAFAASIIGPLFLILMVSGFSYAIIQQRLFDIRLVAARSVAYLLLLALLGSIYGISIFGLSKAFFEDGVSRGVQVLDTIIALLLALTLPFLKKRFDSLTSRLFYQDEFEIRDVLDRLSDELIEQSDLDRIMDSSLEILNGAIRAEFAQLIVLTNSKIYHTKIVGNKARNDRSAFVLDYIKSNPKQTAVYDELQDRSELGAKLSAQNISVVQLLSSHDGIVGVLLLGPKKNGSIYYAKDLHLIGISSKNLAVSVENAKQLQMIEDFNDTLKGKVTQATSKLRLANNRLKKLDATKDDFIAMASHQLRPQITAASGFVAMLEDGIEGKVTKGQGELLDFTRQGIDRINEIVTDMLDISKMTVGKIELDYVNTDLKKIVLDESLRLQARADSKDIIITTNVPSKTVDAKVDKIKLREVMLNFMQNAIHYSHNNSEIQITLKITKKSIFFTVEDQGIGVPKNIQKNLFKKFFRSQAAKNMRPSGTGVGLYIAKQIVDAHNGKLIFESEESKGSTFGFEIPL